MMATPRLNEEEAGILFQAVIDPLLQLGANYVNKMRTGEVPVDMESYILMKRALLEGFQIPAEDMPDDPRELESPIGFTSPFGKERIS